MPDKQTEPAPKGTPTDPQAPPQVIYYVIPPGYAPPPAPPPGAVYGNPQYGPYSTYRSGAPGDAEMAQEPIPEGFESFFDDVEVRRKFIRKVFTVLSMELLITAAVVALFMFVKPMKNFLLLNWWFSFVGLAFMMVFMCILICCEVRRTFPLNYVILTLFAISSSIVLATLCVHFSIYVVLMALTITAIICWVISFAACFCPVDITGCGCMLCITLVSFMLFTTLATIVQLFIGPVPILQYVIGGIGTGLFSLYLMFDIQMVMGGKKVEISPEEEVVAVIQLYIDIIMIFQYVLMLFGLSESN